MNTSTICSNDPLTNMAPRLLSQVAMPSTTGPSKPTDVARKLAACAILTALLAPLAAEGGAEQLVVNEVMTSPLPGTRADSGFYDTYDGVTRFVTSDWVEIYNPFPNKRQVYSYDEFIRSCNAEGWTGLWVSRTVPSHG